MESIIDLLTKLKVENIKELPGAWEHKIDDTWYIACNGHPEPVHCEPPGTMRADIPAYNFCVWYNGWLAALFHPQAGGCFAAGSGANVDTFVASVKAHIKDLDTKEEPTT